MKSRKILLIIFEREINPEWEVLMESSHKAHRGEIELL